MSLHEYPKSSVPIFSVFRVFSGHHSFFAFYLAMIEDSTIIPEPDTAMDRRARLFIIAVTTIFNVTLYGSFGFLHFPITYKHDIFFTIHGVIMFLSFLALLTATFVGMCTASAERKLCYRCWVFTFGLGILVGYFLPNVT